MYVVSVTHELVCGLAGDVVFTYMREWNRLQSRQFAMETCLIIIRLWTAGRDDHAWAVGLLGLCFVLP
jgi:hypothetical protein